MNSKSKTLSNILVFLVALFLLSSLRDHSTTTISFDDDTFTLGAPESFSLTIEYDQVKALELVEQPDSGTAISGAENRKCRWGDWENNTWGQHTQCVLKKLDTAILLITSDEKKVLFNYESDEATASMHQMLTELLAHRTEA